MKRCRWKLYCQAPYLSVTPCCLADRRDTRFPPTGPEAAQSVRHWAYNLNTLFKSKSCQLHNAQLVRKARRGPAYHNKIHNLKEQILVEFVFQQCPWTQMTPQIPACSLGPHSKEASHFIYRSAEVMVQLNRTVSEHCIEFWVRGASIRGSSQVGQSGSETKLRENLFGRFVSKLKALTAVAHSNLPLWCSEGTQMPPLETQVLKTPAPEVGGQIPVCCRGAAPLVEGQVSGSIKGF